MDGHAGTPVRAGWLRNPSFTPKPRMNKLYSSTSSVSLTAGLLKKVGLIDCTRGYVTITNRSGPEKAACEYYGLFTPNVKNYLECQ